MKVILAQPRGFCAGVDRAIAIVERALAIHGAPIYVRHEIVHNRFVVRTLRDKGAVFVDSLDEVPDGATVVFSAHGVPRSVEQEAVRRGFRLYDATCPLVTKVHVEVSRMSKLGYDIVMIGHSGHPEVVGTVGQVAGGMQIVERVEDVRDIVVRDPSRVAYVTQTTLSIDETARIIEALRERFPAIVGPKKADVCYATQNRQDAVKHLAAESDMVFVIGSTTSSNSNRLREVAQLQGTRAYLVDDVGGLDETLIGSGSVIGVTAGASAPEVLVSEFVGRLRQMGAEVESMPAVDERHSFPLPKGLWQSDLDEAARNKEA